jgi:hypothetical protein
MAVLLQQELYAHLEKGDIIFVYWIMIAFSYEHVILFRWFGTFGW